MANVYRSNYNGLQATLNSRNFHGLSMVAGYTYSHALDDVGANWDFGYGSGLAPERLTTRARNMRTAISMCVTASRSRSPMPFPARRAMHRVLEGWELNSIITLQSPQHWGAMDEGTDAAGMGALPVSPPANSPIRWNFYGNPNDFKSGPTGIPFFPGQHAPSRPTSNARAMPRPSLLDGGPRGSNGITGLFGCYANGNSIMIPPPLGTFWQHGTQHLP